MKLIFSFFLFFVITNSFGQTETEVIEFQNKLNKQYAHKGKSPLIKKDFYKFKELPFYKWNAKYAIVATLEMTPKAPLFLINTTTDRKPLYQQYAIAHFIIDGKKKKISIYQSQQSKFSLQYKDYLFLPFKDTTNGKETYEGGRFIDVFISDIKDNKIVIDFNKSYNPYCAYNHDYSCPIPPTENHLNFDVNAGVKKGFLRK